MRSLRTLCHVARNDRHRKRGRNRSGVLFSFRGELKREPVERDAKGLHKQRGVRGVRSETEKRKSPGRRIGRGCRDRVHGIHKAYRDADSVDSRLS